MEDLAIEMLIEQELDYIKSILAKSKRPTYDQKIEACHAAAEKLEAEKDNVLMELGKISELTKPKTVNIYNGYANAAKQDMSAIAYWEYEMGQYIKECTLRKDKFSDKNFKQDDNGFPQKIASLRQNLYSLISEIQKIGYKEGKKTKSSFIGKLGYILNRNKKVKKAEEHSQTKNQTLGE